MNDGAVTAEESESSMSDVTTLGPVRGRTATCSAIGATVIALAAWIVVDSRGHALAVALLVAGVVVSAPFVGELLIPAAFTWHLDSRGIEARTGFRRVRVAWDEIRLAQVVSSAGDPALRLELGPNAPRTIRTLRLPVGADVTELHAALAHHLGPVAGEPEEPDQGTAPGSSSHPEGQ